MKSDRNYFTPSSTADADFAAAAGCCIEVTGGGGASGSGNVAAGKSPHKSNILQVELS